MAIKIQYGPGGKFSFVPDTNEMKASEASRLYSEFHKDWGQRLHAENTVENHSLYAFRIIEPIDKVREYEEWTQVFFHDEAEDFNNPTLFAEDDEYTAMAWTLSPDGGPTMLRPGTPVYSGIAPQRIDTGLEFNIDQLRRTGWNLQERKVKEAGNELARKRNTMRYTVLKAAVESVAANVTTVAGGKLTYASIRNLIQANVNSFYKPNVVVMNTRRAWDMGDWVTPAGEAFFDIKTQLGEEVLLRNGFFTTLFNLQFYLFENCPYDEVWFSNAVAQDYDFIYMPLESAVQNNPLDRTAQYRWLEDRTSYVRSGERYWRFTITA